MTVIHDLGDTVPIVCTFNVDGTPTDMTAVELLVDDPDGTTTDATGDVVNTDTGVYRYVFTPDAAGVWRYQWTATYGTEYEVVTGEVHVAASPGSFTVA